jgi:CHAT domain-containing protein
VTTYEWIREDNRQLDTNLQQFYTDTIAADYRALANLLLEADLVLEAQEVLDLLKLQELQDYELPNVRGTTETQQGLDLWPAEQAILDQFHQALTTGADFDFGAFINSPEVVAQVEQLQRNARGQNLNPEQLVKLQDNLQQAGNVALLYPLILDDRLELVLVTTEGLVRRSVAVSRVELNTAIAAFRSDITDRRTDPIPKAQQLYQWLIAPLAADIDAAGAETLLYAADGALRYIPLAALHDGTQWLTQRYTVNHITAASLTDFSPSATPPLNVLAGAFPEQGLSIDVYGEAIWFDGLPYAQAEVQKLAMSIPGTLALFNQDFNRTTLEPQLNRHTIIHLATHAEFRSGHPSDSFILLGDGDRLTLLDLNQWQLPEVDLVVLSACKTAVSSALGNGEEILGFGYQMQQTGAAAEIASLWYVSDGGTQGLMTEFYAALQQGLPKAEALRQAQIALIASRDSGSGDENRGLGAVLVETASNPALAEGYSHPYYWAPFILIGNGL